MGTGEGEGARERDFGTILANLAAFAMGLF